MGALGTIWHEWYANLHRHAIDLARLNTNQIEVGATPEKVDGGWLLIYSHIQNYHASTLPKILGIEAALLAKDNPLKIIGRTVSPLLVPEADYELKGLIPNVAFPTSAIDRDDHFDLYYGAADTTLAVATMSKADMDAAINQKEHRIPKAHKIHYPIIEPWQSVEWEQNGTFNPGVYNDGKDIHVLYRPQSSKWSSTLGYARLNSPYNVVDRPLKPRYEPRESFERKLLASGYAGCEDPRLTRIGNDIFMCYTAFDSVNSPRVALTHIAQSDFLIQHWSAWSRPKLISAPGVMNKNTLIFPEQAGGKIIMLHRIDPNIYIEKYTEAEFASLGETHFLEPKTCLLVGSVTGREPKSVPIARRTDRHPDGYYFIMGSTDGILNID